MEQLTAQQEATELVDKYFNTFLFINRKSEAKQFALMSIEGRMEELCILPYGMEYLDRLAYLEEIKEEINKL